MGESHPICGSTLRLTTLRLDYAQTDDDPCPVRVRPLWVKGHNAARQNGVYSITSAPRTALTEKCPIRTALLYPTPAA
jgi:hypothetical protein